MLLLSLVFAAGLANTHSRARPTPGVALRNEPAVVFDTGTPPDAFGTDGFDVSATQSVAFRFFSNAEGPLHAVELWLMSNTNGSRPWPTVDVTLRAGSAAAPGPAAQALESWEGVPVLAAGWAPQKVVLNSTKKSELSVAAYYWVVAESSSPGGADPVWAQSNFLAFSSTNGGGETEWQPGAAGQAAACRVLIY
jgi:hypothetical protein